MKIEPIANTNFRGLFVDKTSQNQGNWRMEYHPYSWENQNTSTMSNKEKINIFAGNLPDNEEIYKVGQRESSSDILGTESYYYDKSTSRMRSKIDVMPAMTREESLRVKHKKLDKFIELKENLKYILSRDIEAVYAQAQQSSSNYDSYATDFDRGFWSSARTSKDNKNLMDAAKSDIMDDMQTLYIKSKQHFELDSSINAVKMAQKHYAAEIEELEQARKENMLIDISRRNVNDANQPLLFALRTLKTYTDKLVVLPNKIVSLKEFADILAKHNVNITVKSEVEKYIDLLIKSKV